MSDYIMIHLFLLLLTIGHVELAPQQAPPQAPPQTPPQAPSNTTSSGVGTTNTPPIATTNTGVLGSTTPPYYQGSYSAYQTTPSLESTSSRPLNPNLAVCTVPMTIETYCKDIVTPTQIEAFKTYFNQDISIKGLLGTILVPEIVEDLQEKCVAGNWCLTDSFQKNITQGEGYFYKGPMSLSNSFWDCLEYIGIHRKKCNETELMYLGSVVSVLYDMEIIDGGRISTECYTRTVEAMHVIYSAQTGNKSLIDANNKDGCDDYTKQMTNTYLCAAESCDAEQFQFLKEFQPWSDIAAKAKDVYEKCKLSLQCHSFNTAQVQNTDAAVNANTVTDNQNQNPAANTVNQDQTAAVTVDGNQNATTIADLVKALTDKEAIEEKKMNDKVDELEGVVEAEEVVNEIEQEMFGGQNYGTTDAPQSSGDATGLGAMNGQNMNTPDDDDSEEDKAFIYGMVTVSILVVVGFALIGLFTIKRVTKIRKNYKLGYSRMSEEEQRMLKHEYK